MKNKRKHAILALLGIAILSLPGCGKTTNDPVSASSSVSAVSEEGPVSINENITTASTYYEDPAPAADSGDAEGYIPEDIPEGTVVEAETEKALEFTEKNQKAYTVTIDKAEYTDRQSVIPGDQAEKVLLITYTYESVNGEPRLVDDMSFRLFAEETPMEPYYVADQIMGDVSIDTPVTAEVCFAVPADATEFSLFVVDNAEEKNENYQIILKL